MIASESGRFAKVFNRGGFNFKKTGQHPMQSPLGGIREAALLSDRNEITQMTKFYISHPYFQGISLPHKVFVKHRETDASYKQHWITLLVVPTKLRRFSIALATQTQHCFCSWSMGRRLMLQQTYPDSPE